jgi:hypothetical protein
MRRQILSTAILFTVLFSLATVQASQSVGKIVGWGEQVVGGNLSKGFTAITAGGSHSLGLKADGSIVAWGRNDYGQCNMPLPTGKTMRKQQRFPKIALTLENGINWLNLW